MRTKVSAVTMFFFFLLSSVVFANGTEHVKQEELAREIKDAVIRQDFDKLMKYVSPQGTVFIDSVYTREQINKLIREENSWLFKHLFVGEKSVKSYFERAKDLKIEIHNRNDDAIFVTYQSSSQKPSSWLECCFIRVNGEWYFDGIFSCE